MKQLFRNLRQPVGELCGERTKSTELLLRKKKTNIAL